MFVQIIEGQLADADRFRELYHRWDDELGDDAAGWLGGTAGVTPDGVGVIAARFESAEAASRNSDRPEQDEWWQETAACFDGEPTFADCSEVDLFLGGGSDDAGFVQVIRGRVSDGEAGRRLMKEFERVLPDARPDVLGGYLALHDDDPGAYTQVVYFTSEEQAREGESRETDGDEAALDRQLEQLHEGEPRFLDLPDPWLS
ncbi:MAG: hypothetical protein R3343_07345 [Nitriliruptorales bacterium]|nr:hypothetical protein [Nitriliruptorales bacterium]